jgi:hypothetical protein
MLSYFTLRSFFLRVCPLVALFPITEKRCKIQDVIPYRKYSTINMFKILINKRTLIGTIQ